METIKFIRSRGLEALNEKYAVQIKRHGVYPNLVHFKYHQLNSPMGEPIVQECRGVILDENEDWKVVNRGFNKFFNFGEGHAASLDWSTARVQEKLDGSLLMLYFYRDEWHVATSGTPDALGNVHQTGLTFKDLFWQVWKELGYKLPDDRSMCYQFEMMTPYNRVIVPYEKNRLVLIGARNRISYKEQPSAKVAHYYGWEAIKEHSLTSLEEVVEAAKNIPASEGEGYVVVDKFFRRLKVKSPGYVALHHMADGLSSRRMIEIVRTGESEEFLNYFPQWKNLYGKVKLKFEELADQIESDFFSIKHIENQKEFAIQAQKKKLPGAMFLLRSAKVSNAKAALADMNIKNLEQLIGVV